MKTVFSIKFSTALTLGVLAAGLHAQQPARDAQSVTRAPMISTPSQDPQLKVNPLKVLEESEPAIGEAYQLGAGDTISVYVVGRPEFSKNYIIGPDGSITVDMIGSIKVTDKTREEAATAVADALSKYYTAPSVTVGVEKYGSNTVMIFGNVQHPGILSYEGTTPTLLDAIGRAGLLVNASSTGGLPGRCTIYRGNNTVLLMDLDQLVTNGSALADLRLRRGDKIFIPIDREKFVSVLGQVGKPGPVPIIPGLDLKMALSEAGGLKDEAGDNPMVHVIQTANNREVEIPYKKLMTPGGGSEIVLQPGDVVTISMSGFNKLGYVLAKLNPALTVVSLGALAAH